MSEHLRSFREALARLRLRLSSGEVDESTFDRLRERVLADLTPEERDALGITATPQPVVGEGITPHTGTPTPVGPSGGVRGGLRTARGSLSDLDLEPGSVLLGQWKLVRGLGRGGFGAVFEAEELSLGERHAVKVLDPAMVAKEELLARFRREVSLMRKLVHPRIVRVYDYREDLDQNLALISMELVPEGSVKQLLTTVRERGERIPMPLALNILRQILEALAGAHGKGVIHRDVTPGNVLLAGGTAEELIADPERDPQVKLVDFGIAGLLERTELSAKSRALGTAAYVAPEMLDSSAEITPAVDVYGAGAIAYELLSGQLPTGRFPAPRALRSGVPEGLDAFIVRLLDRNPAGRPEARAADMEARKLAAAGDLQRSTFAHPEVSVPITGKASSPVKESATGPDEGDLERHWWKLLLAGAVIAVCSMVAVERWLAPKPDSKTELRWNQVPVMPAPAQSRGSSESLAEETVQDPSPAAGGRKRTGENGSRQLEAGGAWGPAVLKEMHTLAAFRRRFVEQPDRDNRCFKIFAEQASGISTNKIGFKSCRLTGSVRPCDSEQWVRLPDDLRAWRSEVAAQVDAGEACRLAAEKLSRTLLQDLLSLDSRGGDP